MDEKKLNKCNNKTILASINNIFYDLVCQYYEPSKIIFLNGEDHVTHIHLKDFYNKIIESIHIEQEVDNDFTDWIGRGKIEYILKIRFK